MDFSFISHLLNSTGATPWITFGVVTGVFLVGGLISASFLGRNKVTNKFMGRRFVGLALAITGAGLIVAIPVASFSAGPQREVNEEHYTLAELDDEGHVIRLSVRDGRAYFAYDALNDDGTVSPKYGIYDGENLKINELQEGEKPTLVKRDEFCEYVDVLLVTDLNTQCSATLELTLDESTQIKELSDDEISALVEAWNTREE